MRTLGIDPGIRGGLAIIEINGSAPLIIVEPCVWKKHFHLRGGDKETARQLAIQTFPSAHALFARRKDHQRAEAALIALFAANNRGVP